MRCRAFDAPNAIRLLLLKWLTAIHSRTNRIHCSHMNVIGPSIVLPVLQHVCTEPKLLKHERTFHQTSNDFCVACDDILIQSFVCNWIMRCRTHNAHTCATWKVFDNEIDTIQIYVLLILLSKDFPIIHQITLCSLPSHAIVRKLFRFQHTRSIPVSLVTFARVPMRHRPKLLGVGVCVLIVHRLPRAYRSHLWC